MEKPMKYKPKSVDIGFCAADCDSARIPKLYIHIDNSMGKRHNWVDYENVPMRIEHMIRANESLNNVTAFVLSQKWDLRFIVFDLAWKQCGGKQFSICMANDNSNDN